MKLVLCTCLIASAATALCPSECHRAAQPMSHDCCGSHVSTCQISAAPQWACTCLHAAPVLASFSSAAADLKWNVVALAIPPVVHHRVLPTTPQRPERVRMHAPPLRPLYLIEQQFLI